MKKSVYMHLGSLLEARSKANHLDPLLPPIQQISKIGLDNIYSIELMTQEYSRAFTSR